MEKTEVTEFGNILKDAITASENDISNLVWKDKSGKDVKFVIMTKNELQKVYNHVNDMLYNTNKYTPGKYQVKKNIRELIQECNAELFLRYLTHECNISLLKTNIQILDFVRANKAENNLSDSDSVLNLFTNLPSEFESVTIGNLMDACFDKLSIINKKMISDKFILTQGIWLTESEKEELKELNEDGTQRPWLDVIKDRLVLTNAKLRVDPKGFSYAEFRSLVHLEQLTKISKLPTATLQLLRDKVFMLLDADVDYHIGKWNKIKENIEKVAKYRGFDLTIKNYDN